MDEKRYPAFLIGLLSLCHMGIDFLCAFSLYHSFTSFWQVFLLYNFFAFAGQLPLGILLDAWTDRTKEELFPGYLFTFAGIALTIAGAVFQPVILGLGNAFFHVGGGVLTIREDDHVSYKGRGLGVFVAPGAIGLILGILIYDTPHYDLIRILVSILLAAIMAVIFLTGREREAGEIPLPLDRRDTLIAGACCFLVVVLRSLTGMAIVFSWKTTPLIIFLSVLSLAFGKTAGGFLSSWIGMKKTVLLTLSLSAVCFYFGENIYAGMAALFLFNMTMPMTLYLIKKVLPAYPGAAFGVLTFALFLGYLPVLYGFIRDVSPFPLGTASSLVSLVILLIALWIYERDGHE